MDEKQPSVVELFKGYAPSTGGNSGPSRLNPGDIICRVGIIGGWRDSQKEGGKLEIVPSRFDFSDNLIHATALDEEVLAKFIANYMQHKDLILIDCAPTESVLTRASYHASRYVLIPVKTEFFSTIGFPLMKTSLDDFRKRNRGNKISVCGVVVHRTKTSGSASSTDGRDSLDDIKKQAKNYGWEILSHTMDHSDGYPKWANDPRAVYLGNAKWEWPKIAKEILAKIGLNKRGTKE